MILFQLKIALLGGCVLASPVIIWQIMRFVLPALYKNEKRIFFIMTFFGIVLFVGGVCFGYFLVLRPVMETLIRLAGTELTPMITASSYFTFKPATFLSEVNATPYTLPIIVPSAKFKISFPIILPMLINTRGGRNRHQG